MKIRGKGLLALLTDDIEVFVNDLMDDYDAPIEDPILRRMNKDNSLENNLKGKKGNTTLPIRVEMQTDAEIDIRVRPPIDDDHPVLPGRYSIQIRNNTQKSSLFAPFVINVLPDMPN